MSAAPAPAPQRIIAAFVAALLTSGVMGLLAPGTAGADTQPLTGTPATVAADALPTTQINGVAWAQAVVGNTVYVGGNFSTARPAGAAAGTQETPRANLLAYDIRTGELVTSFAPVLNGQVLAVASSPDGSRLYVGGDFNQVDGQVRNRVAAFDTATGALVPTWRPNINSQVRAIAATNETVYLGGSISAVGGVSRTRLAAVAAADGSLLPWAPVPGPAATTTGNDQVMSLVITGGGSQVVAAGRFDSMNGVKATGVAAIDALTGATRPFAINEKLTNQGDHSAIYSVTTDGVNVYGTAYDYGGPGNLEGSFVARADGGAIVLINDCRGDTYSSYPVDGALYIAGHPHECGNIGGFPEENPRIHKFAAAFTTTPFGVVGSRTIKNSNLRGLPAGKMLAWTPTMAPGTFTGQGQAGWSVTGNGRYVAYAGEFPRVNGQGQQGLVRYAVPALAPNKIGPVAGPATSVTSPQPGLARIAWTTTNDPDNEHLTYSVYREGRAAPVYETVKASLWWQNSQLSATDAGVSGSLRYRVVATDAFGNQAAGEWIPVEVAPAPATTAVDYPAMVRTDGASSHWRLGETSGPAADSVGTRPLTVGSGVSRGVTGALSGDADTAYSFNGSATATLATQSATAAPNTFTAEAWFQTSSGSGGRILGFASAASGSSSTYDRQVYLDSRGRVNFGVKTPANKNRLTVRTVTSSASFNDGKWHHVAASLSSAGMALYVDGTLVDARTDTTTGQAYNGYFRVGSDRAMGGTNSFTGRIDEVALYPKALSGARVAAHAAAGTNAQPANLPPTARFAATADGLVAGFDGTGATDVDGTITGYAWNFGDGSTGAGATASRTYAAAGTYPVTLTVTDNRGATSTATRLVTVAPVVPNAVPTAAFTASAQHLALTVDASAAADSDGVLTGYAWNFGDGATATGVTASHAYARAGTYTVTLTVTDDDGATASAEKVVEVTAPPVQVVIADDAFGRTVTGGLGTADKGGVWTASAGPTRQSVEPGSAVLRLDGPNQNTGSYLGDIAQSDADVLTSFSLDAMPTGGGTMVFVSGRRVGTGQEYRVRVRFAPDGTVGLALSRLVGGTETFPGGEVVVPGLTYTAGSKVNARVRVSGTGTTEITASVWRDGSAEPSTPALTRTDTTAELQAAGAVGLTVHRPTSATAANVVRFTGFRVVTLAAAQVPVNEPPVAAFTATPTGLAVAVDGAGSGDPDGRVVSYAWDFGDGGTAEGVTASYTYAEGGTYPVTLTVTDDSGESRSTTQDVTVSAPAVEVVASDTFAREVTGGWGSADVGGAWTVAAGGTRQSVTPGVGEFRLDAAGHNTGSYLDGIRRTDANVLTTFSLSAMPTGNGTYVYVTGRRVGTGQEYRVRVRVLADGRVALALSRLAGGTETFPGGELVVPGLVYAPGAALNVRVQVSGTGTTAVSATVWLAGTEEPSAASLTRTDTTAELQAAGGIGLLAHRPGGTTVATAVRFTGFLVTPVG
ncbi:PKD domain-containing protein [Blastococcus sp. PRF04-17]|uniref:PKD domain-containing protein n=1 Tax=Blastococcus sp. PRF04-17 TaxID=2933797 RepID=UPI001FF3414B|nr:PKD domain-containing protein [Blastococcus sp. PRF04-17]UOX99768.1 PKD domain-containing protein [Blastococcus sp. PRF04-17]